MGKLSPNLSYFTFSINTARATEKQLVSLEIEMVATIAPKPSKIQQKGGPRPQEGFAAQLPSRTQGAAPEGKPLQLPRQQLRVKVLSHPKTSFSLKRCHFFKGNIFFSVNADYSFFIFIYFSSSCWRLLWEVKGMVK